ncbi:MAG TPA: hypothetical protein DEO83_08955 [Lachnospiraceae bacterium]|nr:hypothetical protein [Lachnospiraceae bacterium]
MWPYTEHSEEEYNKAVYFVLQYAESLGEKYICTKQEKFTTISGDEDPFPYNLTEEELKAEVRYSLGIKR